MLNGVSVLSTDGLVDRIGLGPLALHALLAGIADHNASLLEVWTDETEHRTWFLFESSRGADTGGH